MAKEYLSIVEETNYRNSDVWIFSGGTSIDLHFVDTDNYLTSIWVWPSRN